MQTLHSTWSYRTSFIYSGLKLTLVGFVWHHELQQFKIFIDSVNYEYTYDQTIMNKERESTVWIHTWYRMAGNFQRKRLPQISRFCGCSRKFSLQIWGHGILWHSKSEQSAKVFFPKIVFFINSWKFSPLKVSSIWYLRMTTALIYAHSQLK